MTGLAAYRKTTPAARAELDAEIRRRNYGDLQGLRAWLAERGIVVGKSAMGAYVIKLKRADLSAAPLEPSAIAEFALNAISYLQADPPPHGFPAAARRQLQNALAAVVTSVHRCRIAHESSPA